MPVPALRFRPDFPRDRSRLSLGRPGGDGAAAPCPRTLSLCLPARRAGRLRHPVRPRPGQAQLGEEGRPLGPCVSPGFCSPTRTGRKVGKRPRSRNVRHRAGVNYSGNITTVHTVSSLQPAALLPETVLPTSLLPLRAPPAAWGSCPSGPVHWETLSVSPGSCWPPHQDAAATPAR